jgi:hypothetical protein
MTWITFDEKTRSALSELSDTPVRLADDSIDPLDYALASERSSVVLAPFGSSQHVVLLTVKKNVREEPVTPPVDAAKHEATTPKREATRTSHYVSSGFLGLSDEVEVEDEPEQSRSWWKRLFE